MADEKVTVVESGGGGASVVALIVGLIALLAVLYVIFGTDLLSSGTPEKIDADITIDTPAK